VVLVERERLAPEGTEALDEVVPDTIMAGNADAALQAARANPEAPPTVLVTHIDLGAGDMDGLALAGEVRRRWPNLEMVYVTDHPSRLGGHGLGARDRRCFPQIKSKWRPPGERYRV